MSRAEPTAAAVLPLGNAANKVSTRLLKKNYLAVTRTLRASCSPPPPIAPASTISQLITRRCIAAINLSEER